MTTRTPKPAGIRVDRGKRVNLAEQRVLHHLRVDARYFETTQLPRVDFRHAPNVIPIRLKPAKHQLGKFFFAPITPRTKKGTRLLPAPR